MAVKIATLNLCLGLKSKKVDVENLLLHNDIGILCLQEVEIESSFNADLLNIKNYNFELENNSSKARVGIYISKNVEYKRMRHLEGVDSHIVVLDLSNCAVKRIVNIYRSFNPQNNVNARIKFKYQLELIKDAMTERCIVVGDFNLDYSKIADVNYGYKNLFNDFDELLGNFELVQLVNFVTWSRLVGMSLRSSILDHIYIKDPTIVNNLRSIDMLFGDHVLVEFNVVYHKTDREIVKCRDWRKYSKESLIAKLSTIDWNIDIDNVQEFWNSFEKKLINVIDEIVPLTAFNGGVVKTNIPKNIKNKINKRNRLLKSFKKSPTLGLKSRIADLNCEIRSHFFIEKSLK